MPDINEAHGARCRCAPGWHEVRSWLKRGSVLIGQQVHPCTSSSDQHDGSHGGWTEVATPSCWGAGMGVHHCVCGVCS